jgi:hypothetical protein
LRRHDQGLALAHLKTLRQPHARSRYAEIGTDFAKVRFLPHRMPAVKAIVHCGMRFPPFTRVGLGV